MSVFAISDLHLSFSAPFDPKSISLPLYKPMDIFGPLWSDYPRRLAENWQRLVKAEDTVLLSGDLSWAMTLEEMTHDLDYLAKLPGKKVIIKGNHDYWWQSYRKVQDFLPPGVAALQHTAMAVEHWAVCGTRGWLLPGNNEYKENQDLKIYEREAIRLELALTEAKKLGKPIIALLHYPPLLKEGEDTAFSQLLEAYQVRWCLYGHIHGSAPAAFTGERNGVLYANCSCDRLDFCPKEITEE